MVSSSFADNLTFNADKVTTSVILETPFSKEIRILLRKGQLMKEHKTPYPIILHVLEGEIRFGVEGLEQPMKKGSIIALEGNVAHNLNALEDSVVRLTLSRADKAERVEKVVRDTPEQE